MNEPSTAAAPEPRGPHRPGQGLADGVRRGRDGRDHSDGRAAGPAGPSRAATLAVRAEERRRATRAAAGIWPRSGEPRTASRTSWPVTTQAGLWLRIRLRPGYLCVMADRVISLRGERSRYFGPAAPIPATRWGQRPTTSTAISTTRACGNQASCGGCSPGLRRWARRHGRASWSTGTWLATTATCTIRGWRACRSDLPGQGVGHPDHRTRRVDPHLRYRHAGGSMAYRRPSPGHPAPGRTAKSRPPPRRLPPGHRS